MSTELEKGSRWLSEIAHELEAADFGIIVLTPGNINSDWILFEAGALSKRVRDSRVCTYLCGELKPTDISGPLSQFQHTLASRSETRRLIRDLNALLGESALTDVDLEEVFTHWWPTLETAMTSALSQDDTSRRKRRLDDMLEEVLATVRSLRRDVDAPLQNVMVWFDARLEDSRAIAAMELAGACPVHLRQVRIWNIHRRDDEDTTIGVGVCCEPMINTMLKHLRAAENDATGGKPKRMKVVPTSGFSKAETPPNRE